MFETTFQRKTRDDASVKGDGGEGEAHLRCLGAGGREKLEIKRVLFADCDGGGALGRGF